METVVVLELDASALKKLQEMGGAAQAAGGFANFSKRNGVGGEVKVPGMEPPKQGIGSTTMPTKGIGAKGAAAIGIIAEKLIEETLGFAQKLLNGSKVLNSIFGTMGKMLSAAVDILLIPFTPLLNMLMLGLTKLLVWMVSNNIPGRLYNGMVAIWRFFVSAYSWIRDVIGFFNGSFNPAKWDWGALLSGLVAVISKFFRWIVAKLGDGVEALLKLVKSGARLVNKGATSLLGNIASSLTGGLLPSGMAKAAINRGEGALQTGAGATFDFLTSGSGATYQGGQSRPMGDTTINITQEINTTDPIQAGQEAASTLGSAQMSGKPLGGLVGAGRTFSFGQ